MSQVQAIVFEAKPDPFGQMRVYRRGINLPMEDAERLLAELRGISRDVTDYWKSGAQELADELEKAIEKVKNANV